jgi:hypothetical protein
VEKTAHRTATSGDAALATHLAAVAIEGGQAGGFGHGAATKGAQLRHGAEKSQGGMLANTNGLFQAPSVRFELCMGIAQDAQLPLDFFDFPSEEANDALRLREQPTILGLMGAAFLHSALGDEMISSRQQRFQALDVRGCWFIGLR